MEFDQQQQIQSNNILNYYLISNKNHICRLCLERSTKLAPIFDPIKPPHFSIQIMACANVQIEPNDPFPPSICQKCISRLNLAYQFKLQCEGSDAKLRQCYQSLEMQNNAEFTVEYPVKNESQPDGTLVSLVPNETEPKIDFNLDGVYSQTTELQLMQDPNYTDYKLPLVSYEPEKPIKIEDLKPPELAKITPKIHNCDTCGKIFKSKPSLVHHIRIHTGERPYSCKICSKSFMNGGHLHTHMKTHTGEKNHVCAACNKAFTTAQQLTKHIIAIHTSERPYGCTYCPKRFANASNLTTHVKVHTGEKNFHCEICGKMFSTNGQLQQHSKVHTGEKAFLCEFCDKRFSQKAHLTRHLRTHNRTE